MNGPPVRVRLASRPLRRHPQPATLRRSPAGAREAAARAWRRRPAPVVSCGSRAAAEGVADRLAQVRDRDHDHAVDHRARRRGATSGTMAVRKPSRAASRSRRSRPGTGRNSPSSPTSPMAIEIRGPRAGRAATRPGPGRAAGPGPDRPDPGRPPGWRRRRGCRRPDAGAPAQNRDQQGQPVRVDARRGPARDCRSRRARRGPGPRPAAAAIPRAWPRRRSPARARPRPPGMPGPDRRPRPGRARPSRRRRPPRSSRSGSWWRAGAAASRSARPSRLSTASTRCSRVLGPARVPSLVTWPTTMTAMPSPLAISISRSAHSRTCPTDPAGPSSSSTVTVWIESTTRTPGRPSRARSPMRPTSFSATTLDALARGMPSSSPSRPARSRTCPADSSPWHRGSGPPVAGQAGRRLEQQSGLADARLAAEQHDGPGHEPAAQDAVELARCRVGDADGLGLAQTRQRLGLPAVRRRPEPRRPTVRRFGRPRGPASRRECSRPPQVRHWPSQRMWAAPHAWQMYRLCWRANPLDLG